MKIKIGKVVETGKPFFVDVEKLVYGRLGIYASSGGGKSMAARLLSELTQETIPQIILDKNGEFNTLREKFDFVLAGPEGDLPAAVSTAGKLALKIMELGSNLIVDLSGLKPDEKHEYVKHFVRAMMDAPKSLWRKRFFIVDEAHKFCPENGEGVSAAKEGIIESAEDGRKREIGTTLLTQRVVKLDKSAMAELQNKMVGLTNTPDDRQRAAKELGFKDKDKIFSLGKLEPGQFYCLGPAFGKEIALVQLDLPKTSHERKRGRGKAPAPTSKVKAVLSKLKDIPQEIKQEAETMASLRAQIAEMKREIPKLILKPGEAIPKLGVQPGNFIPNPANIEKQVNERVQKHIRETKELLIKRVTGPAAKFFHKIDELKEAATVFNQAVNEITKQSERTGYKVETLKAIAEMPKIELKIPKRISIQTEGYFSKDPSNDGTQEFKPNKTQKDVLKFLAARPGKSFSMAQVAAICVVANSGSFSTYISALASQGFIKRSNGMLEIANLEGAIQLLGPDYAEPSRDLNEWISKLNPTQKKVFEILRDNQGTEFPLEHLAGAVGVANSGSFSTYISEMSTLGLVKRQNGLVQFNKEILDL